MESPAPWERSGSWAFHLALCLLGPFLFLSYLFSVLAPFPSLYLLAGSPNRGAGRFWWLVSLFVGGGLSFAIHGWIGAVGFALFAGIPAFVLGEMLLAKRGPELAVAAAFTAICIGLFGTFAVVAKSQGYGLLPGAHALADVLKQFFKETAQNYLAMGKNDWAETTVQSLQQIVDNPAVVLPELPGLLAMGILLLCIAPCILLIRWNPKGFLHRAGIGRDFLRKWRSPEWLVWPAVFSVTFFLFDDVRYLSPIARICMKPLLLIYFFQGMSILAYFLDSIRLPGPIRVPVYLLMSTLMYPMVMSFGFFDLWLNFRNRRRSGEVEKDDET